MWLSLKFNQMTNFLKMAKQRLGIPEIDYVWKIHGWFYDEVEVNEASRNLSIQNQPF